MNDEISYERWLQRIEDKIDRGHDRMDAHFTEFRESQTEIQKEMHAHNVSDEARFGKIEGTLQARTWQASIAYVVALVAAILGFKVPGGSP